MLVDCEAAFKFNLNILCFTLQSLLHFTLEVVLSLIDFFVGQINVLLVNLALLLLSVPISYPFHTISVAEVSRLSMPIFRGAWALLTRVSYLMGVILLQAFVGGLGLSKSASFSLKRPPFLNFLLLIRLDLAESLPADRGRLLRGEAFATVPRRALFVSRLRRRVIVEHGGACDALADLALHFLFLSLASQGVAPPVSLAPLSRRACTLAWGTIFIS